MAMAFLDPTGLALEVVAKAQSLIGVPRRRRGSSFLVID